MKESKKSQEQRDLLIAQSNDLVRAKYSTSLWERRLFIEMIQSIKQADTEFQWVTLYYSDLVKTYQTTSRNDYDRITKAAKSLGQKVMFLPFLETYEDGSTEEREISEAVIKVDVPKNLDDGFRKYIKLKFNNKLKPLLLKLERDYFLYDKANIIGLRGKYTFDFYELFKQLERENKGVIKIYFPLDKFREHFLLDKYGNPTKKYKKFSDIEKYVIRPSQKEMRDLTDLSFSYDKVKEGRTVIGIEFEGYKNRKQKTKEQQTKQLPGQKEITFDPVTPDLADPIYQSEDLQRLIDIGVTPSTAMKLVKDFDSDLILYTIKKAHQENEKKRLGNFAGFVVKMIKSGDYQKELQQQQQRQEQKQKEAKEKAIKKEHDRQIRELEKQFEQVKKTKVSEIVATLETEEQEKVLSYVRDKFGVFLKGKKKEEILSSYFFGVGGAEYLTENGQMTTKQSDFYEWIEATHKVKVVKNGDLFEVVG